MSGINIYSFHRWILGIALVAISGIVLAGPVTDPAVPYVDGDSLNASKMNSIRNAVNDNDTRITALQNGTPTCGATMTAVGPTCVDNARQVTQTSWIAAVETCRAAGKRLLTPGEFIAAFNQNAAGFGITVNGQFEWVDSVAQNASVNGIVGNGQGKMLASFMGPSGLVTPVGGILFGNDRTYDQAALSNIHTRCAR
jgi:hypothetical protein